MKYVIGTILTIAFVLWAGECKITWSPFSFSLPAWRVPLAWFLFVVAIALYGDHRHRQGISKGAHLMRTAIERYVSDKKAEQSKTEEQTCKE